MVDLRTFDVKHCAEDNEQLVELYKDKVRPSFAGAGTGAELYLPRRQAPAMRR
jgi:hypothetical protein